MPAKGQVKIIWQIVFLFIPILNFWAFYRIEKLRKFLMFVWLPEVIISFAISAPVILSNAQRALNDRPPLDGFIFQTIILYGVGIGFAILEIFLIYKWSKEWNSKFQGNDRFPNYNQV